MAKKRANGEGSIRKKPSGRWEGRYTQGIDPVTGRAIQKSVSAKTQAACKEKLAKAIRENRGVPLNHTGDYTAAEWCRLWFETYSKPNIRYNTAKGYEGIIEHHIIPAIGAIKLKQLSSIHIQRMYNDLKENGRMPRGAKQNDKPLSNTFVRRVHAVLQAALKQAVKERLIPYNPCENCRIPPKDNVTSEAAPIRPKELGQLISDAIVNGDENDAASIKELLEELKKHFDPETEENNDSIPTIGGVFDDRTIVIENHQSDLRRLVGTVCNPIAWGGLMETEESVLKDAISADIKSFNSFNPVDAESMVAFHGGIDGSQSLFDFIKQFDAQFKAKNIETAEMFIPIIEELLTLRNKLLGNLDMIMYYPVLSFGVDEEARNTLIGYIDAWAKLYHAFSINEPAMREMSPSSTSFIARALLLLDVLYVKTPKEWKAILLPLHPIYLWRYYEIFKILPSKKSQLSEDDAVALTTVLTQLPQILSFVIANSIVTETSDDKVLPCSGNIEMLPTFENKTNRYLGDDGTQSIGEILTRWIGFAPYTKNEIRICSVDAPDLIANIRAIKTFMDKSGCEKVVYDVYLTRKQNGNTELSRLDYSGKDYEIGEFIRQSKIAISIRNVESASDVKAALSEKPVHIAFYFDQSTYAIEFGPNNKNLYINPLVVTYDYDFDEIQHRGSIFPSSEMDSGLIGDYHMISSY